MKNKMSDIFYNMYKKTINDCQKKELQKYKKIYNKIVIKIILLIMVVLVLLYCMCANSVILYYKIIIVILFIVLLIGLLILNVNSLIKEKKESYYIINAVIYHFILCFLSNNNFQYQLNKKIPKKDFNKMNLFNMNYLIYNGSNSTVANYDGKTLIMGDVWLYDLVTRIKTDSYYSKVTKTTYITRYHYHDKVNIFKGLYYETTINRDNNTYIYLIPNNLNDKFIQKHIYHYISYDGSKIELENLEFSEKYSVFSFDEIKSRYILSLNLMEKINKLDKLIPNKKYFVFKSDGNVGIFIDGFQIDNILKQKFELEKEISKEHIEKIFNQVNNLFNITKILEDFNPYE